MVKTSKRASAHFTVTYTNTPTCCQSWYKCKMSLCCSVCRCWFREKLPACCSVPPLQRFTQLRFLAMRYLWGWNFSQLQVVCKTLSEHSRGKMSSSENYSHLRWGRDPQLFIHLRNLWSCCGNMTLYTGSITNTKHPKAFLSLLAISTTQIWGKK